MPNRDSGRRLIRIETIGSEAVLWFADGMTGLIDTADLHFLDGRVWSVRSWGDDLHYVTSAGQPLHRLILGNPPNGVDHQNHNGLDNRRSNLRLATGTENAQNRRVQKNNKLGLKGVSWHRQSQVFRAQIQVKGKRITIGGYRSAAVAAKAYNEAAVRYYGEFACLNDLSCFAEAELLEVPPNRVGRKGSNNGNSKLNELQVRVARRIKQQPERVMTNKDLACLFGVSKLTIGRAMAGNTWTHL